tara:strand:- start:21 stop:188 length:168 start_codon:yes stop_codon:yes gene_type:complete
VPKIGLLQEASGVLSNEKISPPGRGREKGIKAIQSPRIIRRVAEMGKILFFFTAR